MNVIVYLNDEAGVDYFSIYPEDDVGNWINSFISEIEAKEYCKENGYKIVGMDFCIGYGNPRYLYLNERYTELKTTNYFEIEGK